LTGLPSSAVVTSELIYGASSVGVKLLRSTYASLGGGANGQEIGRALDRIGADPGVYFGSLLDRIDAVSTETGVRAVFSELNPVVYNELYHLSLLRLEDVQKPISDRLNHLGAAGLSSGSLAALAASVGGGSEWSAWTNAFAGSGNVEADQRNGFSGLSRNEGGDVTGVERRLGRLTVGVFGASSVRRRALGGAERECQFGRVARGFVCVVAVQ